MIDQHFRLSKYDPALRDEQGAFRGDHWTSVSDIGATFAGEQLTTSHYLAVEAAHLTAVVAFAEESGIESLQVGALSHGSGFREGQSVSLLEAAEAVRANLRETLDCVLEAPGRFHVHVGFDYYVYLGSHRRCPASVEHARSLGLFVDEGFRSPMLDQE